MRSNTRYLIFCSFIPKHVCRLRQDLICFNLCHTRTRLKLLSSTKLTAFLNGKYDLLPLCIQVKFNIYQLKVTNSISRGDDFRTDYSHLGMLCALFPSVPVLALSATASKKDRQVIKTHCI